MRNDDDNIELLIKVFDNQQTIISNADTKANISITIQTFIITSVLGASIITDTFNNIAGLSFIVKGLYYLFFIGFMFSSISGLICCALVFKPRLPQEKKEVERKGITYFGHIVKHKSSKEYLEAIKDTSSSDIVKEFASQNYSLSIILQSKMKHVKSSINFLFANIILGVLLLLFSLITK